MILVLVVPGHDKVPLPSTPIHSLIHKSFFFIKVYLRRHSLLTVSCPLVNLWARKVVALSNLVKVTSAKDTKVRLSLAVLGLLQVIPPEVDVALNQRAGDILPVSAGVDGAGNSLALVVTLDGPTGLGDVDGLALGDGLGLVEAGVEEVVGRLDGVGVGLLPVGVAVEADPVDGVDDGGVGAVLKAVVRVDVAHGDVGERGAGDGLADLADVADELVGVDTGAGGVALRGAVQVLGSDRDADHEVGEGGAVGGDGRLQGGELVVDGRRAA